MDQKVMARYVRIAPRKVGIVAALIRRKNVNEALNILQFVPKAASPILTRLVKSGIAAATQRSAVDANKLFIKELRSDQGPLQRNAKRFISRAMGRASKIHKFTSHLTLVVSDGEKETTEVKA